MQVFIFFFYLFGYLSDKNKYPENIQNVYSTVHRSWWKNKLIKKFGEFSPFFGFFLSCGLD